jgi:hypothetical protein
VDWRLIHWLSFVDRTVLKIVDRSRSTRRKLALGGNNRQEASQPRKGGFPLGISDHEMKGEIAHESSALVYDLSAVRHLDHKSYFHSFGMMVLELDNIRAIQSAL